MEKKKVLNFVKNHKKTIAYLAVVTVGVAVGGSVVHKMMAKKKLVSTYETKDLDIPSDWEVGRLDSVWRDKQQKAVVGIIDHLKLEDLGKFGEEALKIDGVTEDTDVSLIFGIENEAK